MKSQFLKISDLVEDSWYLEAGDGKIVKILKTKMKIYFNRALISYCPLFRFHKNGIVTYDKAHYKFLKKIKNNEV